MEDAEYRALPENTELEPVLRFTLSQNRALLEEARRRAAQWPNIDEELSRLVERDLDNAILYVAQVYEGPCGRLAPAWGRMMERQIENWDVLQYDEQAARSGPKVEGYLERARTIQRSGGDL